MYRGKREHEGENVARAKTLIFLEKAERMYFFPARFSSKVKSRLFDLAARYQTKKKKK